MDTETTSEMRRYARLARNHATHFNWHEKRTKEAGVIDTFLDPTNCADIHDYVTFTLPESDPPDAIIYKKDGKAQLIEITELVNEAAIDAQIAANRSGELDARRNYSREAEKWANGDYFWSQVNARIMDKVRKCEKLFYSGDHVSLLMHTDEMYIEASLNDHLAEGSRLTENPFHDIWLLLSYQPGSKKHPIEILQGTPNKALEADT